MLCFDNKYVPYLEVNGNSRGKTEKSFGAVDVKFRKIHLTTFEFLENLEERSQMDFSELYYNGSKWLFPLASSYGGIYWDSLKKLTHL